MKAIGWRSIQQAPLHSLPPRFLHLVLVPSRLPMPKLSSMLATFAAASQAQWDPVADDPLSAYWTALNTTVGGRLFQGTPFAKPCFGDELTAQCASVRAGYTDEWTRASTPGAWINTQWETCQASGAQCLLGDIGQEANGSANGSSASCEQGSVPLYFVRPVRWCARRCLT